MRYEGMGGGPISTKKGYVTLEWPLRNERIRGTKRVGEISNKVQERRLSGIGM